MPVPAEGPSLGDRQPRIQRRVLELISDGTPGELIQKSSFMTKTYADIQKQIDALSREEPGAWPGWRPDRRGTGWS